ncbi:CBS domain-containing protein [Selenihalanaerobacter shriftii]|uniref:CBS domain-containing protein n=1 Tax=Selenihalanaerobacter shriftii TaxID=142842 RepID=A0A1T4L0V7_9FIRM|nr:CBS domain-containing protein [Selenihalanaerobacter shriftii]SJZ48372.1 CBS domain-containing protein [Selenihalanaerobacter shriftii]
MTTDVITVGPTATLRDIAYLLVEERISAVPVVDPKEGLLGMINERALIKMPLPSCLELLGDNFYLPDVDVYRKKLLEGLSESVLDHLIEAHTFSYDTPITQIAATMISKNIREGVIMKEAEIVGIISKSDIVRAMINANQSNNGIEE